MHSDFRGGIETSSIDLWLEQITLVYYFYHNF